MSVALSLKNIDRMSPDEESRFFELFEGKLAFDDGSAALGHLEAGRPVVYTDFSTPPNHVLRKYPDGRVELVDYSTGKPNVVRLLKP